MSEESNKCKHCGKKLSYNKLLSIYECNDEMCWLKRIPKDISKIMGTEDTIAEQLSTKTPMSPIEGAIRISGAAIKSGYNVVRAIGKFFKNNF